MDSRYGCTCLKVTRFIDSRAICRRTFSDGWCESRLLKDASRPTAWTALGSRWSTRWGSTCSFTSRRARSMFISGSSAAFAGYALRHRRDPRFVFGS